MTLVGFTLAIPNLHHVEHSALPLLTIARFWMPKWLVKVFIAFVVFSMFAIAVVGAGAQSRLAYAMARDNMLPGSKPMRRIDPTTQTPIVALVVFAFIDIGILIYGYTQPNSFAHARRRDGDHPLSHLLRDHRRLRSQAQGDRRLPRRIQPRSLGQARDRLRAGVDARRPGDAHPLVSLQRR